jgi:transaldolase
MITFPPTSEVAMNATTRLHEVGQSLWLDNITRDLLSSGTLQRYCTEFSVTGLTSNPTIFDEAIRNSNAYDGALHQKTKEGKAGEKLFFELALEDLTQAAALFGPAHEATGGIDGWVSLEVSPLLANDASATVEAAKRLHTQAHCSNLFIKIPGTPAGVEAIEESIFAGVPVNVTLLFSREHYIAAADAYSRGVQRRIDAGLDPKIASVASIFVSRWDKAMMDKVSPALRNRLGIAISRQVYKAYRERLASAGWRKLADAGALSQRLLWANTRIGSQPGRVTVLTSQYQSLRSDPNLAASWHGVSGIDYEVKYCCVEQCRVDQACRDIGTQFELNANFWSGAISQERFKTPEKFIHVASVGIEFLMLCKGEQQRCQFDSSIDPFSRCRNVSTYAFGLVCSSLGESESGFDYCQKISEVMGYTPCHFAQRSKPMRCTIALLVRSWGTERRAWHIGALIAFRLRLWLNFAGKYGARHESRPPSSPTTARKLALPFASSYFVPFVAEGRASRAHDLSAADDPFRHDVFDSRECLEGLIR